MKYRILGATGLRVSVVGLGTWQFGGEWGKTFVQREVSRIIETARDRGINLIDTAECYGNHLSEALIGRCLDRSERENWIIATKFGHAFHDFMRRSQCWSPREVEQQLHDSLKALRTDYVDLYQFHSGGDEVFDNDALWTMLRRKVEEGTIRHLGISIGNTRTGIHQVDSAADVGARAIQVVYNRLDRRPEERVFPSCRRQNLGVVARVPLAGGYLSGKYEPGASFGPDDVRSRHSHEAVDRDLEEVAKIERDEVPEGIPTARWALAWCLQHPAVTTVIPGCKNVEQVRQNAAAADLDTVRDDHPRAAPDV